MVNKTISQHELLEMRPTTSYASGDYASVNTRDDAIDDDRDDAIKHNKSSARSSSRFLDFLRPFRLQVVASALRPCTRGRWNANTERRKVAIYRNRAMALAFSLIHVAPLAGAITLLAFQWTNLWISDKDDYSSALQFAAKIHELVMQASIVDVLLSFIRTGLVDSLLPLGTLTGVLQPTQLSYLWSLDFFSIFQTRTIQWWRKLLLVIAIPALFALTALVGPSSAVLMIPRAGSPRVITDRTKYASGSVEVIYPARRLSAAQFDNDYSDVDMSLYKSYPYKYQDDGFGHFEWHAQVISADPIKYEKYYPRVLRWSEGVVDVPGVPEYEGGFMTHSERTMTNATIPPRFLSLADYFTLYRVRGDGNITDSIVAAHPVVGVQCWTPLQYRKFRSGVGWDSSHHLTSFLPDVNTVVAQAANNSYDAGDQFLFSPVWVPPTGSNNHPLLVLFLSADIRPDSSSPVLATLIEKADSDYHVYATACSVSAYWNTGEIQSTDSGLDIFIDTGRLSTVQQSEVREIDIDFTSASTLRNASFHRDLSMYSFSEDSNWAIQRGLAALLATWLSNLPLEGRMKDVIYNHNDTKSVLETTPSSDYIAFRVITREFGYGYGTRSTSVYLAMTVLLSYCIIIVTNILYTLITGSTSTAWSSGVEIITLALQSRRPDHLGYTGVGIDSLKTLREDVGIRLNTDNEVELVFAHDREFRTSGLRKLEQNTAY